MKTTLFCTARVFLARGNCSSSHFCRKASFSSGIFSKRDDQDFYERPEGLSPDEQVEWDAMMEDPVIHDLFYGMGSSGQSGGERPDTAPGTLCGE